MPRLITQTVIADFRGRLCDVAAVLFAEQGRDGFNMRELAKRLRVSPMTAYRYFRDKEEILAALRARAFARFAEKLEATHTIPSRQRNAALALAYGQFVREEEASYRLMFDLFQPHQNAVPELAVQERRARTAMTEHARTMIQDGVFHGEPELIGQILWSALHGVAALHLANKLSAADFDRALPEAACMLGNAYGGGRDSQAGDWPMLAAREPRSSPSGYSGLAALPAAE